MATDAGGSGAPPLAPRREHTVVWHGQTFIDPWFWLREKSNPEVIRYLEAENAHTDAHTADARRLGEVIYKEALGRIQQTDLGVPVRIGKHGYYHRTEEGRQYPIHCRRLIGADGDSGPEEVLLDLNVLAGDGIFLSLGGMEVSPDGGRLLYSVDRTGFRQYSLYLKDLATGKAEGPLAERVRGFQWALDGRTLFYVTEDPVTKRSNQLWRRSASGTTTLVFEEKDELFSLDLGRTKDRAFLVCSVASTDTWEQWLLRADEPEGPFRVVMPREKGHKYDLEHRRGTLFLRTNRGAKNFRLVSAPVSKPGEWTEWIPARADVLLEGMEVFDQYLVVQEQREALARWRIHSFAGGDWKEVVFPEPVYWASAPGTPEFASTELRISYQSMVTPPSTYDCRMADGQLVLRKRTAVPGGYDPAQYVTERHWATARDGVKVPLSLVRRRSTPVDGTAACHLYGYGSYGLGMEAAFSVARLSLLDRGVVCVIAHIRGGNELGEAWHDDGMLMKKKNTFHDFVDSAEWLVGRRMVDRQRILIEGGSAGGLLMGAVVNLRPDLFRAVHLAVPFVDVMNTMMDATLPLTVGEYLEWGNPNEKAAFDYMLSYSPYDNLKRGDYPSMLVTTSLNDSQVMYWEPAKYVAKLRTLKTDRNPLHLKCNMGAGHGGASGRYDRLKEVAFEYAWLLVQAGIRD